MKTMGSWALSICWGVIGTVGGGGTLGCGSRNRDDTERDPPSGRRDAGPGATPVGSTAPAAIDIPAEDRPPAQALACDMKRVPRPAPSGLEPVGGCTSADCGTNSSYMTGSELDALSLDGCANRDGIRLVLDSLRSDDARCPHEPYAIDVVQGELVGRAVAPGARGQTCRGSSLTGATFWVEGQEALLPGAPFVNRRDSREALARVQLRVAAIGEVVTVDGDRVLPSYVIEPTGRLRSWNGSTWIAVELPILASAIDSCRHAREWGGLAGDSADAPPAAGSAAGSGRSAGAGSSLSGPRRFRPVERVVSGQHRFLRSVVSPLRSEIDQHALIAAGEVYDNEGAVTPVTSPDRWFHFACAGGALAKTRLMGLDPALGHTDRAERTAVHRMWMARYCNKSETRSGEAVVVLESLRDSAGARTRQPDMGPVEARWTERGASCVSHLRAYHRSTLARNERDRLALIRARCDDLPECPAETDPLAADEYRVTYTIDHDDRLYRGSADLVDTVETRERANPIHLDGADPRRAETIDAGVPRGRGRPR